MAQSLNYQIIPAWGKIALGITGAAIAIGILAGTMGGMAAAVSVGSELLLGSLLGGATDAAISLACGERDTNELLHDFADGAIDGFMFTGIFAPIGAAGAVSRYAKNAEGFVSKGSISKAGYGAESGSFSKGVGNPVEVVGRGSTGRTVPNTLNEQMAMHQVMSNPLEGAVDMSQLKNHPVIMSDSRWLASEGWVKMSNNVNGVEIHFVYNKITGEFDDFKYK